MRATVRWEDQRAFLAVIEERSLSGAARRLGVTQPTVRARIDALESALGSVLFTRSVNGLTPTAQARALAASARAMARASDAFVRAASGKPGDIGGSVRLSVADFVGVEVLPTMLASLRVAHPRIAIEVALSNASADLFEQEVDIAVRMHPPQQGKLVANWVGAIPLGLYAHKDYLARKGVPTAVEDLAGHDIIGPDNDRIDLEVATAVHPNLTRDRFAMRTDSHPTQLGLARAGLGIAVVHRPVGNADPRLQPVLPELVVGLLDTWIVMHEDLREVPRIRVVFDHLIAAFGEYVLRA